MKAKRIIAFVVATVLVLLLAFGYFEFYGYPITKYIAGKEMKKYISNNYSTLEYTISNVTFNFKDDSYSIYMDIKDSEDKDFTVSYLDGEVSDDYQWSVVERENTAHRLQAYLNDENFEQPSKDIFKDNLSFSLITYNDDDFKTNPPPLDMPIEKMIQIYPLEITIYLNNKVNYTADERELLKSQIKEAYQKVGIPLAVILIES